ncbi:hypothetical protein [Micromonospora sp. NPDC057140]|uniref:hypothetical protein n=1 Tax=Micromonospora sp. NPDC057140 TaxID=3346032 RepID=UPI00363E52D9
MKHRDHGPGPGASTSRRFPHVRFDYSSTDVLTAADVVGHICPRCLAATSGSRDRRQRQSWVRTSPDPGADRPSLSR